MTRAQDRDNERQAAYQFGYSAGYDGKAQTHVIEKFQNPLKRGDLQFRDKDHALYGWSQGVGAKQRDTYAALHDDAIAKREQVKVDRVVKWDTRYLAVATSVAAWSKDPSTKVGAVLVKDNRIVSTGFNGYAERMDDSDYDVRERKYSRIIHAEMNCLLPVGRIARGATLYCTHPLCDRCAVHVIQAGIKRVVVDGATTIGGSRPASMLKRWEDSITDAHNYLHEARVQLEYLHGVDDV